MRSVWMGKLAGVGAALLALVLVLGMIGELVAERQGRMQEAQHSVADSLAGEQRLVGPMLLRRCEESWDSAMGEGQDRKLHSERREFQLASVPKRLAIDARAALEPRDRGLFRINAYSLKASVKAHWSELAVLEPRAEHAPSRLRCGAPVLLLALGDARGLRSAALRVQGQALDLQPGSTRKHHAQGVHAPLPQALFQGAAALDAEFELELVGTEALAFAPVGDDTRVSLASDWPHPSFNGRFLPTEREVNAQGFSARWQTSALATKAARDLLADAEEVESFGVGFFDPVSPYVLSDRATKYGLLFIVLTFTGVGLVEVLRRRRVHPVQYLLVGLALAVFFLLLLSLTEHFPFGWAYLAASSACTLLLAYYGRHVLGSRQGGALFGAAIAALYGALYLLLQLEQTALVLGSVLLFAALALVMVATRRVDWYALAASLRAPPA